MDDLDHEQALNAPSEVLILRFERGRLTALLRDFIAGAGILALYSLCLTVSLAGVGFAAMRLRGYILSTPELVTWLALAAGLWIWVATWRGATHLLAEAGVEFGPALRWLSLLGAPVLFGLIVLVHLVGAFASDLKGPLRWVGYVLGAVVVVNLLVLLVLLVLRLLKIL